MRDRTVSFEVHRTHPLFMHRSRAEGHVNVLVLHEVPDDKDSPQSILPQVLVSRDALAT